MAEFYKSKAECNSGNSGKTLEEAPVTPEESKRESPSKSVSSADTRESAASSADAIEEDVDAKEEDFLPVWIREKKYSEVPEEADKQLWEDLRKVDEERKKKGESFLEQAFIKYIFIDAQTRKPYVEMATSYHEKVVKLLIGFVNKQSTPDHPVLAQGNGKIFLENGSFKYPDVYIFGKKRTFIDEEFGVLDIKMIQGEGNKKRKLLEQNPHAIIEVSWTNKIEDELEKFTLQMGKCNKEKLGAIKVGYLIKFIPLKEMPTEENPVPRLKGIHVYRMKLEDEEPALIVEWRYDDENTKDLNITAEDLEQETGGKGVSIPLGIIKSAVTRCGIKFQEPDEN